MRLPRYTADHFTDSGRESGTAQRKARFVNTFLRFVADGFPRERFTRQLYMGLSTHGYFGFIAHYDIHGFYHEQMGTPQRQASFLRTLEVACERRGGSGRADLWNDVEAVLREHLEDGQLRVPKRHLSPTPAFGTARPPRHDPPTLF